MLFPPLATTPFFLALVLWTTAAEGALYRTASIGGSGGAGGFNDFTRTVIGSLSDYRPHNILLWQECVNGGSCNVGSGFTGFEPSHAICETFNCYIKWDRKSVINNWPDVGPTSDVVLEHGDFVEMMYGYIRIGEGTYSGLYLLNGVGIVVRKRGAEGVSEEIFAGYREGLYVEILGPLVAFWGDVGGAFDQLGAYMDPSVWPERPSRLVAREMHGILQGGAATDTYFISVDASGRPYAMRLLNMTIFYNDTSIVDIAAAFEDDLGGVIHWSVGTNGSYTYQSTIASTGPGRIDALRIAMQTAGEGACLSGLVVRVVYSNGTLADTTFGSIPSAEYTTEGQIVGFHGIAGENCIKRLGVYTQMDSSELKDTCQLPSLSRLADNVTLALDADLPERIQNGTEVTFACTDGFALTKGGVLTCGDDGIWQGVLPECAPVVPSVSISVTTEPAVTITESTNITISVYTTVTTSAYTTVTTSAYTTVTTSAYTTVTTPAYTTVTTSAYTTVTTSAYTTVTTPVYTTVTTSAYTTSTTSAYITVTVTESVTVAVTTSVTTGSTSGAALGPDAPASAIWSSCQYFFIPFIIALGLSLILLLVLTLVLGIICSKLRSRSGQAYKQYPLTQEPLSQLDVTMPNPLFVDDDPKPPAVAEDEVGMGLDSQELRVHISETDMQKELV